MYMHLKAYETLHELNDVSFNIKFMIEGEEECGSDNLEKFVINNKEYILIRLKNVYICNIYYIRKIIK